MSLLSYNVTERAGIRRSYVCIVEWTVKKWLDEFQDPNSHLE
jgi:hypothetical protein